MKMKALSAMVKVVLATATLPAIALEGPSTSAAPYLQAVAPGVELTSVMTVGDTADNGYRMVGLLDGLGAYDNEDGSFTLLMNHELKDAVGIARAHNSPDGKGAFVSEWVIDKNTLRVISGGDLMKQVYGWDAQNQKSDINPSQFTFGRFCSADLPRRGAFYNPKSKLGTKARIFMNGEEGGATGYALAHVASGADKGNTYVLGKFNLATNGSGSDAVGGWENLLANPRSGDKTVVIGNNDGGTGIMKNTVAVYVGTKTDTGSEVDKAGLTNGILKFVNVEDVAKELNDSVNRTTGIVSGTAFSLSDTGTVFSRPEDGAWANAKTYYFVTTDQLDKTDLAEGTQKGGTRLWRLNFNEDYTGGTIDVVLDTANMPSGLGIDKPSMFDNISVNSDDTITLQEDVGNSEHNGKIWQFSPEDGSLKILTKFDAELFGDVDADGIFTAGSHTKDEETSGVIDITGILDRDDHKRYNLLVAQDHQKADVLQSIGAIDPAADAAELVEGGQLLLMSAPSYEAEDHDDDHEEHREEHHEHK